MGAGEARRRRAPGPPRHLVRRRHAARPGHGHPDGAARQLRAQGRHLPAHARPARRASTCPTSRTPTRGRADGAGHALPAGVGGDGRHQRPDRRHADRQALPDQGLDRLRPERPREHPAARSRRWRPSTRSTCWSSWTCCRSSRSATPTSCCPRPPTSSATTRRSSSTTAKKPFVSIRQPVMRAAPRVEARLVDRQGSWPRGWASRRGSPGQTPDEHLGDDHRADGDQRRSSSATAAPSRSRAAVPRGPHRRRRAAFRHRQRQDRALLAGPRRTSAPTRCRATRRSTSRRPASSA